MTRQPKTYTAKDFNEIQNIINNKKEKDKEYSRNFYKSHQDEIKARTLKVYYINKYKDFNIEQLKNEIIKRQEEINFINDYIKFKETGTQTENITKKTRGRPKKENKDNKDNIDNKETNEQKIERLEQELIKLKNNKTKENNKENKTENKEELLIPIPINI